MKIVKLEDYCSSDYICYIDEYNNMQLIGTDEIEEIKRLSEQGKTFYGINEDFVFDNPYWNIRNMIDERIEDRGYEDMGGNVNYDTDEFKNLVSAFEKWIDSLGSTNTVYYQDVDTIIEVKNNVEM